MRLASIDPRRTVDVLDLNQYVTGVAGLARLLESGVDFAQLCQRLESRGRGNPPDANALLDLSTLLLMTPIPENRAFAFKMQQQALELRQVYHLRPSAAAATLRLLVLMAPGDMTANTPVDCLLEDTDVEITMLYVLPGHPLPAALPDHDLVFVAIGESEQGQLLLRQLDGLSKLSGKPVLNSPDRIRLLTRDRISALLRSVPGAVMPATARVDRASLLALAQGEAAVSSLLDAGRFPIIVRPVASHGGKNLAKIDNAADLAAYVAGLAEREFYLSNYIDYRSSDGQFRKYRLAMFAGRSFACHMAISSHWMIHYFNADMTGSEAKRREEEQFMSNFEHSFAQTHEQGLASIFRSLGLDFIVLDCGETQEGKLLLFEVDTAAIVHALDDPELFPYKRAQMRKLFSAFREMLQARARLGARAQIPTK